MEIVDYDVFRVTRDADFEVDDEADDLLRAVEARAAPAPLRRGRAGRGRGRHEPARCASRSCEALEVEEDELFEVDGLLDLKDLWDIVGVPGFSELRDQPWTPVTQPRLQPDDDAPPDVLAAMRRGDLLVHHPYDSFTTSVERLRRAGGRRPEGARDQADRVPHERRLAARAGADPRGRARQAGRLPRGAQGALRRARQHRLGARAGGGGRARRLRPADAQDPRQVRPHRAPRGRRRAPLRPRRDRQLPPEDRAPVHGLRPVHLRRGDRRRRRRHVQPAHGLRSPAARRGRCWSPPPTCATA